MGLLGYNSVLLIQVGMLQEQHQTEFEYQINELQNEAQQIGTKYFRAVMMEVLVLFTTLQPYANFTQELDISM